MTQTIYPSIAAHVRQERRKTAAGLQNLVLEKEIREDMTVKELIAWLRGEVKEEPTP